MQKLFFTLLLSVASLLIHAQVQVSGAILDSASREPLVSASVFCQNTTSGTYSNKQGEFSLSLKSGGYDLIITYTGYQTQTIRVTADTKLEILMVKEDKSIGEVVVKSSSEVADGWTKYGDFFTQNFIGNTPNARNVTINNPQALKFYFYKKSNRLKVLATEAIQVTNNALGYNMRFQLDSFVYYYNSNISSYRGYCLYSEMDGTDSLKKVWAAARKNAYYGSRLHFLRSYYDSTLNEDGWKVEMLDEANKKYITVPAPYDSSYYNVTQNTRDSLGADSIQHAVPSGPVLVEIFYPRKLAVSYTLKAPEKEYLAQMKLSFSTTYRTSYIDLKDWIAISPNGYYYDQRDWINQGYWSWKNLADQLPYDYEPE